MREPESSSAIQRRTATQTEGPSRLDRDRAASLADEGGASAARFDARELAPAESVAEGNRTRPGEPGTVKLQPETAACGGLRGDVMRDHSLQKAGVTGFVTGLLAGGMLGLLLAPTSGRTARARLSYRLRETAGSARGLTERMNHRVRETAGSARELGEKLRRRLRPAAAFRRKAP
jgi:hypothetical protein